MHGINYPWRLPSYRFGNLVVAFLKDDKTPESIEKIDDALAEADSARNPFADDNFRIMVRSFAGIFASTSVKSDTIDNVIYDPRFGELPIEERKRREAIAAGKPYRVPEWWRGEKTNYKIAKAMMVALPKKMGPVKPQ